MEETGTIVKRLELTYRLKEPVDTMEFLAMVQDTLGRYTLEKMARDYCPVKCEVSVRSVD